jgi:hypothetical protein
MATRMMTLLYGDKPEVDVEPGNRVDTADDSAPPTILSMEEQAPWASQLGGLVRGLLAAVAVLSGVTLTLIAFVWSRSITPGAQVTLVVLGVVMIAGGTAYVVGPRSGSALRRRGGRRAGSPQIR